VSPRYALTALLLFAAGCGGGASTEEQSSGTTGIAAAPKPVQLVGLRLSEARERLFDAGWTEAPSYRDPLSSWTVCSQYPPEQQQPEKSSDGKYYMSLDSGPHCDSITVPNLVGGTEADAVRWANSIGILLDVEHNDPQSRPDPDTWVVCRQTPTAGTVVGRTGDDSWYWVDVRPRGKCYRP